MMQNPSEFFDHVRRTILGPTLSPAEVTGCNIILKAMEGSPIAYVAYALATAYHETATTMCPIKERGGPAYFHRMYDVEGARPRLAKANGNVNPGDGCRYFGRGYVQLTWRDNYKRAGEVLGLDLIENPELALLPDVAALVMQRGMVEGWFTGRRLVHYLPSLQPATLSEFIAARRIINGVDRADDIAEYAQEFQHALTLGGWA